MYATNRSISVAKHVQFIQKVFFAWVDKSYDTRTFEHLVGESSVIGSSAREAINASHPKKVSHESCTSSTCILFIISVGQRERAKRRVYAYDCHADRKSFSHAGLSGNSSSRSVGAACHFFVSYTYSSRYKLFRMLCIRGITADMQLSSAPLLYHRIHTMYDIWTLQLSTLCVYLLRDRFASLLCSALAVTSPKLMALALLATSLKRTYPREWGRCACVFWLLNAGGQKVARETTATRVHRAVVQYELKWKQRM